MRIVKRGDWSDTQLEGICHRCWTAVEFGQSEGESTPISSGVTSVKVRCPVCREYIYVKVPTVPHEG